MKQPAAEVEDVRQENERLRQKLEIEASLERVRVAALKMQVSEELVDVSSILFEEFSLLGISPTRTAITIWSEAKDQWRSWVRRNIKSKTTIFDETLEKVCAGISVHGAGFEAWKRGTSHRFTEYVGEDRLIFFREIQTHYNETDEWFEEAVAKTPDPFFLYQIFFSQGCVEIGMGARFADTELQIVQRLVDVFDIAYRRYGELQEVEAARAQLEKQNTALEANLRLLRETQNQLVLQEKMASLGDLVAGVAHEINSPLGAIRSMHDTLVRAIGKLRQELDASAQNETTLPLFEMIAEANTVIATGSDRVSRIIDSLRNFARLDEAEFQVVDLHEGIDSALMLLETQLVGRIETVKNYGDIPLIYCAPGQLNQVFMHLLKNSIQAIEGEGRITISTFAEGNNVLVCFSDTGRGMAADQLERLFDFDFQFADHRVKMGFGLAADLKILQDHKGELKVSSEQGRGTEMTLVLPVPKAV